MIIINFVLVFVFVSIATGFRIDLQNEGKSKSPFYRTFNRIRRSEESEDASDDMEVAENRFIPQAFHSFLPFPPPHHGYLPGGYPHFGHHQQMFGHSGWHNRNEYEPEGHNYESHHGFGHGHGHGHVHGFGCGHDYHHDHNHINKVDKSTPTSIINPGEVTTPSTSTTSEIYDIDVRLGS